MVLLGVIWQGLLAKRERSEGRGKSEAGAVSCSRKGGEKTLSSFTEEH